MTKHMAGHGLQLRGLHNGLSLLHQFTFFTSNIQEGDVIPTQPQ